MQRPAQTTERRSKTRFAFARDAKYRVTARPVLAGEGQTVNMSSSGILFTANHALRPGDPVELSISWPVRLDGKYPLKLTARGEVVRFCDGVAAMNVLGYEFRTAATTNGSLRVEAANGGAQPLRVNGHDTSQGQ
jgi:hypothetical protein